MPLHREEGAALIAELVLASIVVLVVASATAAAGIVADVAQSSREAARTAAVVAARTGDPLQAQRAAVSLAPHDGSVTVEMAGDTARARVTARARLPHPISHSLPIAISELVEVPVAPYRSNRG